MSESADWFSISRTSLGPILLLQKLFLKNILRSFSLQKKFIRIRFILGSNLILVLMKIQFMGIVKKMETTTKYGIEGQLYTDGFTFYI